MGHLARQPNKGLLFKCYLESFSRLPLSNNNITSGMIAIAVKQNLLIVFIKYFPKMHNHQHELMLIESHSSAQSSIFVEKQAQQETYNECKANTKYNIPAV